MLEFTMLLTSIVPGHLFLEIVCHEGFMQCPEQSEGSRIKPDLPAPLSCSHAFKGVLWGQVWVFGHEDFFSPNPSKRTPLGPFQRTKSRKSVTG